MKRLPKISCLFFVVPACLPAYSWADTPVINPPEEIVVTATRFKQRPQDLPIGVSIINAEQIKHSTASSLPELLQELAGIHIRNVDGSPDPEIDLRGFGKTGNQNTLILLDGQRLSEIELVGIRWSTIPLDSVERIEVLRSGGAVPYGGGATGGVINIVTRAAAPGRVTGSVGASIGSYNTVELRAVLNAASETLGLALTADSIESDNYRVNNKLRQKNLQGDLRTLFPGGKVMLKFGADDQTLGLPANRTEAQLQSDRRGTSTPRDFNTRQGGYVTFGTEYAVEFGELAADLSFRDNHRTALFDDYAIDFFDAKSFIDTRSDVWSFAPRIKLPYYQSLQGLGLRHELVVGLNFDRWNYRSRRFTGAETSPGAASATTAQTDVLATQENRALYLQHATTFNQGTVITLGARLHQVENVADDRLNPAAYARGQQSRSVRASEVGARHPLDSATTLYGKLGRSFRIATVDEIYSQFGGPAFDAIITLLEPQTSREGELGIEYRQGPVRGRAAAYQIDLNNEIGFTALNFANINFPPTQRQGFELEGSWAATGALDLFGNYTYSDARFREGNIGGVNVAGKTIPLVPRHTATAGGSFRFAAKTRLAAAINYVGEQVLDNDQANSTTLRIPGYATADLKLTHESSGWLLGVAVNNLFDKKYFSYGIRNFAGTSFSALPARERNLSFSAKYQFK